MESKACNSCHIEKPINDFRVRKMRYKERVCLYTLSVCKECELKYKGQHRDIEYFGGKRRQVLERDSWTCQACGMSQEEHMYKYGRSLTVDHIDGNGRYSKVKNNSLDNLQTLCLSCHGKKDMNRRNWRPVKHKLKSINYLKKG